jgi:6-phospho-beta-glucosidase
VPVVLELRETARRGAKDAWVVDLTARSASSYRHSDEGHRAIGLCNSAIGFQKHIAGLLDVAPDRVALEHVGLNHLTWERAARVDGVDRLPELIATRAEEIGERIGIPADLIRLLGAIPSYYLRYFYLSDVVLREQMSGSKRSRAEEVMAIEEGLLGPRSRPRRPAFGTARRGVLQRSRGAAIALYAGTATTGWSTSEDSAILGRPMRWWRSQPESAPVGPSRKFRRLAARCSGLVRQVSVWEARCAAIDGDRSAALKALFELVGRYSVATALLDALLEANRRRLPRFFPQG